MKRTTILFASCVAVAASVSILATWRPGAESSALLPAVEGLLPADAHSDVALVPERERTAVEQTPAAVARRRVLFIDARDGTPIPGIRIHVSEQVVAGPSGEDGWIELGELSPAELTVWGEAWVPVLIRRGAELPETVQLQRADASLEVALDNFGPEYRVVRTLLQPHDRHATGTAPWDPALAEWAVGLWGARDLPAGEYDLYVWVEDPSSAIKPLSAPRTLLTAGRRTTVRLDANTPAPVEEDH